MEFPIMTCNGRISRHFPPRVRGTAIRWDFIEEMDSTEVPQFFAEMKTLRYTLSEPGRTVTFLEKLVRCAAFTDRFLDAASEVGILRTSDRQYVMYNSKILGGFLGITGNGVNANWRPHSNEAPLKLESWEHPIRVPLLAGHPLPDDAHWYTRPLEDPTDLDPIPEPPLSVREFSRRQWQSVFGNDLARPAAEVFNTFVRDPGDSEARTAALRGNFDELRARAPGVLGTDDESVSCTDFADLFLQYGGRSGRLEQISELTPGGDSTFRPGFWLGGAKSEVRRLWATARVGSWVIFEGGMIGSRDSNCQGTFVLLRKTSESGSREMIVVDPRPENGAKRLTIGAGIAEPNWDALLTRLGLSANNALGVAREEKAQASTGLGTGPVVDSRLAEIEDSHMFDPWY
jgi:hypothetical protein